MTAPTRWFALAVAAALLAPVATPTPAPAQDYRFEMPQADAPPPDAPLSDGDLPGGPPAIDHETAPIDLLMQDLFRRAQPHLEGLAREMQGTMGELTPAFRELAGLVDDIGNYQMPERLPNGDIVIRRRADAPPPPPLDELPGLMPRLSPDLPPGHPPLSPFDPTRPQIDL